MITFGILMAYTTNYLFAPDLFGIIGWRWMLLFGAAPAAVLATGTYFLPETPRWLVEKGRTWEARDVLSRPRATDDIDGEIEQIREVSETESEGDLSDLLAPRVRPALVIGGRP